MGLLSITLVGFVFIFKWLLGLQCGPFGELLVYTSVSLINILGPQNSGKHCVLHYIKYLIFIRGHTIDLFLVFSILDLSTCIQDHCMRSISSVYIIGQNLIAKVFLK